MYNTLGMEVKISVNQFHIWVKVSKKSIVHLSFNGISFSVKKISGFLTEIIFS